MLPTLLSYCSLTYSTLTYVEDTDADSTCNEKKQQQEVTSRNCYSIAIDTTHSQCQNIYLLMPEDVLVGDLLVDW
jgi:hypothetical protein